MKCIYCGCGLVNEKAVVCNVCNRHQGGISRKLNWIRSYPWTTWLANASPVVATVALLISVYEARSAKESYEQAVETRILAEETLEKSEASQRASDKAYGFASTAKIDAGAALKDASTANKNANISLSETGDLRNRILYVMQALEVLETQRHDMKNPERDRYMQLLNIVRELVETVHLGGKETETHWKNRRDDLLRQHALLKGFKEEKSMPVDTYLKMIDKLKKELEDYKRDSEKNMRDE